MKMVLIAVAVIALPLTALAAQQAADPAPLFFAQGGDFAQQQGRFGGGGLRGRFLQRRLERGRQLPPIPAGVTELRYGRDQTQAVDLYPRPANAAAARPPLVLFIHGGGWRTGNRRISVGEKAAFFTAQGYQFASTGYRLLPTPVEDQARDIGAAIAALRRDAGRLGFDPDRIILMGHSAGAHLAALVATDPTYAGRDFAAIRGVILLDGAGYDVVRQAQANGPLLRQLYGDAFGSDPARQRRLSPITHVGRPDAPDWLILHVDRQSAPEQSRALGEALRAAGARADVVLVPDRNHGTLNRQLGERGDFASGRVEAFLQRVLR